MVTSGGTSTSTRPREELFENTSFEFVWALRESQGLYRIVQYLHVLVPYEYKCYGGCFRTSSMVLTTPAIEIEPSGDVSYLGVQPFRVHDSYLAIASCL